MQDAVENFLNRRGVPRAIQVSAPRNTSPYRFSTARTRRELTFRAVKLQAWTVWATAVVFVSGVLQIAAFLFIRTPVWGSADMLAQGAIWAAVLVFAIAVRPSVVARALAPQPLYVGLPPTP